MKAVMKIFDPGFQTKGIFDANKMDKLKETLEETIERKRRLSKALGESNAAKNYRKKIDVLDMKDIVHLQMAAQDEVNEDDGTPIRCPDQQYEKDVNREEVETYFNQNCENIKTVFQYFDEDKNGKLGKEERQKMEAVLKIFDTDRNGHLDEDEMSKLKTTLQETIKRKK